ncbi:hypothetical protein ACF1G0_21810 [Streptomyces sp. NPDC013953]|uniref:hypothetical protein n=1 Tax=Streptomyces sp. NPDC013953 TaxID=3364868 RepID=UPI0036FC33F8
METKPKVVVQPPDGRGLRRISIGGTTVGSAWTLRGLLKILRGLGYPKDMDVHDRASICWRGGGSETWPDRTWLRRSAGAFLIAGLLGSMILLALIGIPDAFGALTFAQRMAGFVFILSGVVEGVAALAVLDFWGKRQLRYTGAMILVAVLIALGTNSMLLFMWLQEMEYTLYLLAYPPLWLWSIWALWLLLREKAWRGMPHPKKFAAGVAATTLLATVNLAYSAVYQPGSAPAFFKLTARFGTPIADSVRPIIYIPLTLYAKNVGKIPAYIVNDVYMVQGHSAKFSDKKEGGLRELRKAMEDGVDAELHTGVPDTQTISAGRFYGPGSWLEPGEEYSKQKVIQLPKNAEYDWIEARLDMDIMRRDRGRIDDEFNVPHHSWEKEEGLFYCPPEECLEFMVHRGRLSHNNNILNVTRRPVYLSSEWGLTPEGPTWYTYLSSSPDFIAEDEAALKDAEDETSREMERYGVLNTYTSAVVPFSALLKSSSTQHSSTHRTTAIN